MPQIRYLYEQQWKSQWCWCAVAVSVARTYVPALSLTQGNLAALILGDVACDTRDPDLCNSPHELDDALTFVDHFNGIAMPLNITDIAKELEASRPVCAKVIWNDSIGGSHFVAISGCDVGTGAITVEDPLFGHTPTINLFQFAEAYRGVGTWNLTYLTK
jgi:hypothetical protein